MELLNLDIQLMATLWENTYRAAIKDQNGNYVASVHIREKFKNEIDQIYFFYPSPEDVLNKTVDVQEVQH